MKQKRAAVSRPTRKQLKQIEERLALLLLLVQHNIDKLLRPHRSR
jgi:hypothetical protein